MPPKTAAKEKPQKGDEAEETILTYMKAENRPYSSTDVAINLKGKVPKAAAQKIMQALADKGTLTVKPYGKQTVFVYNQSLLTVLPASEMGDIDDALKTAKEQLGTKIKTVKELQAELQAMEAMPKTKELDGEIKRIKAEVRNEVTLKTLLPCRGTSIGETGITPMSADETKKIDSEFAKWRKVWVERRKVYKELLGFFQDGGVTDIKQFEEDQGVTPDDDDALALETSELCLPPPRPITKRPPAKTALAAVKSAPKKRPIPMIPPGSPSETSSDSEDENLPKKKPKKV